MILVVVLFLLPIVQQEAFGNGQNISSPNVRPKRSVLDFVSYMCPTTQATGNDLGEKSFIIFRSPTEDKDIRISYANGTWPIEQLIENGFNSTKPTLLYSHGFHQSSNKTWLMNARSIYDELHETLTEPYFNMLIFDWSSYSNLEYWTSVSYVPHLGHILGQFLEQLGKRQSYNMDNMHMVGYSLSTHIAGAAGRHVAGNYGPVGQVTALDPTGVCLHHPSEFAGANALKPTDAKFVVARHYNMDGFGAKRPIGGLDIFINGGREQPQPQTNRYPSRRYKRSDSVALHPSVLGNYDGEDDFDDSNLVVEGRPDHHRATEHETQTMNELCHELAHECDSYEAYLRGECADCGPNGSKCYYISNFKNLVAQQKGIQFRPTSDYRRGTKMFLKTHHQEPFCLHLYQMLAEMSPNATVAAKKLLSSGGVEFKLQNDEVVKMSGPVDGNKFTALISSLDKIQTLDGMILKVNANNETFKSFLETLDHVELNYMSHPVAEERANASYRFCLNDSRNSLVKC